MSKYNRKVFLINPKFQISLIGWFLLLSIFLICFFYVTNWYFFYNFANKASTAGLPEGHVFFRFLDEQKYLMNKLFLFASVFTILTLCIGGLLISHKIAGPLYRLVRHLNLSSRDDLTPVKFRKGDYFLDLEEAYNDYLKRKK